MTGPPRCEALDVSLVSRVELCHSPQTHQNALELLAGCGEMLNVHHDLCDL